MKYERIKRELENSATLKVLRSRNAALILSFLARQFKTTQTNSIPQIELETKLGDFLEDLHNDEPEIYTRSPTEYLNEWCDDRLLRKTFDNSDEPLFTLTPAAEKAIAWLAFYKYFPY